jgi:hypothetical protein
MIDITSTSFGLLIANLLPGLVTLFGLSYFLPGLRRLFAAFLNGESNLGLFLLVALASIVVSMQVTLVRWYIFELHLCKKHSLAPKDFEGLGGAGKITAFRAAVDEHYRYHQFFGCMTVALPILLIGWAVENSIFGGFWQGLLFSVMFLLLEGLTVMGAFRAYISYVERAKHIMIGG